VFLVTGEEVLLVQETCDLLRAAALERGFSERSVWHVGPGFAWGDWLQQSLTGSLFAPRQLIELRLPTGGKLADEGARALADYAQRASPDNTLMILAGKLDADAQRGRWYKAIDANGVIVQVWPLTRAQLPAWVTRRLRQQGFRPTPGAVTLLVEQTEGNPLACAQEIDKLALLLGGGVLDEEMITSAVADSARFNVYGLVDSALEGDGRRVMRVLDRLREEGTEPILVLWALARELRTLAQLADALARGQGFDAACASQRLWDSRKPLVKKGIQRLSADALATLLARGLTVDRMIKGDLSGDPWDELLKLALAISGVDALADFTARVAAR
jgi:DNA polymerase-3 subunit delta